MDLKILNSILNGELKPWLIKIEERDLKELVKQTNNKVLKTNADIGNCLKLLLVSFPTLLEDSKSLSNEQIVPLLYYSNLPTENTLLNHFYKNIIDTSILKYYNEVLNNPYIKDKELDVPFQVNHKSLKAIVALCNQANNEIEENRFENNNTSINETTFFALTYLRNSLITLYFSIQEYFKEYLTETYATFGDFALYCLDSTRFEVELNKIKVNSEIKSIAKSDNKAFNFGFKGDEQNLINLIKILCVHKNLLDEQVTKQQDFIELLTTRNITTKPYYVKIGCKTNMFTYIAESLKKNLPKFTFANIDKCNYFFSDTNTPIKQSLLSNSKSGNPISKQVKADIDKIFKENNM